MYQFSYRNTKMPLHSRWTKVPGFKSILNVRAICYGCKDGPEV